MVKKKLQEEGLSTQDNVIVSVGIPMHAQLHFWGTTPVIGIFKLENIGPWLA